MPSEPKDKELYARVKKQVYERMPVHSAYRSSHLVKLYKAEFKRIYGGSKRAYTGPSQKTNRNDGLTRWHREKWRSDTGEVGYRDRSSVYRPTERITEDTPRTFSELLEEEIQRAKKEKRETGRVSRFGSSGESGDVPLKQSGVPKKSLWKPVFSESDRKDKKYSVLTPSGRKIYFGDPNSQQWKDSTGLGVYTHLNHNDPKRRRSYLARAGGIRNKAKELTKDNPEYANYYSIRYLW